MGPEFLAALSIALAAGILPAQQNGAPALSGGAISRPAPLAYYFVGPNVSSPQVLPLNPLPVFTGKCKKQDDSVEFVVIVDESGDPRRVTYSRGLVTDADKLALQIINDDRFMPGTHNGEPAAVEISVKVSLKGCVESVKHDSGEKSEVFHLRSQPSQEISAVLKPQSVDSQTPANPEGPVLYRVGGIVTAPIPLNAAEVNYTDAARKAKIQGTCWISVIIDTNGVPQNAKVIRGLDPGLDQKAVDSVSKYRFKPAMRRGQPVPVMVMIMVNFRLY